MVWGPTEYLLAAVVDVLALANWQRGGGKGKRPGPIDRPGEATAPQRLTPDDMARRLKTLRERESQ